MPTATSSEVTSTISTVEDYERLIADNRKLIARNDVKLAEFYQADRLADADTLRTSNMALIKATYDMSEALRNDRIGAVKVTLSQVRLNRGGYEMGTGVYWGNDYLKLYRYEVEASNGYEMDVIRAVDRDTAKDKIVKLWPNATFHR